MELQLQNKVAESIEAIDNGAKELDMVINIGKLISGDYEYVKNDISEVVKLLMIEMLL